MKDISLKSAFRAVLQGIDTPSFTVDDLTQAYLNHSSSLHTSKKAARQFVYRNMQRLMKAGCMERIYADGRWPRYTLTASFFKSAAGDSGSQIETPAPSPKPDQVACIKERLKLHQAEVLTALGEMEEYDVICRDMPDLREIAQPRYNESRERCSRLLGRVKALETLLTAKAG
jgi:hypothetical protein